MGGCAARLGMAAFLFLPAGGYFLDAQSGQVTGRVLRSDGTAAAAALVSLRQVSTATVNRNAGNPDVMSGADGTFIFTQIPDATYAVCVQLGGSDQLNPCTWSATPTTVVISGGQPVAVPDIRLAMGQRVRAVLTDAAGLIAAAQSATRQPGKPGKFLKLGIWLPNGLFIPMIPDAGANGLSHSLYVAASVSLSLSIVSNYLTINPGGSLATAGSTRVNNSGFDQWTIPLTSANIGTALPITVTGSAP